MSRTPATRTLDHAGVDYVVTEYEAPEPGTAGYGDALIDATGLDPAHAAKTLIAMIDGHQAVVAVIPIADSLDPKALARLAGGKKAVLADPAVAERLTGSVVGGIAPLGHRTRLPVFVDESLVHGEVIHVSGGRRGLELSLAPVDLVAVTGARVAVLVR